MFKRMFPWAEADRQERIKRNAQKQADALEAFVRGIVQEELKRERRKL